MSSNTCIGPPRWADHSVVATIQKSFIFLKSMIFSAFYLPFIFGRTEEHFEFGQLFKMESYNITDNFNRRKWFTVKFALQKDVPLTTIIPNSVGGWVSYSKIIHRTYTSLTLINRLEMTSPTPVANDCLWRTANCNSQWNRSRFTTKQNLFSCLLS